MLAPSQKRLRSRSRLRAASRVKRWARERFSLSPEATILVTEAEGTLPGFPALVTTIAFWSAERKHYHFHVFKPLEQVAEADLPPAWYKEALEVSAGSQCSC